MCTPRRRSILAALAAIALAAGAAPAALAQPMAFPTRPVGVLAPARTTADLVAKLHADILAVMNSDEVRRELAGLGLTVRTTTPPQFGDLIRHDMARWKKVIADAQVTAD